MNVRELLCWAIVGIFVVFRARADRAPRRLLGRLGLLAAAAWLGENSMIRAYSFYRYDESWGLFLDQVPLTIILIWPVVIHSAWDLSGYLKVRYRALATAALVFADAWLVEPVAVNGGFWRWSEPGLFEVPVIGVLGWALFAGAAAAGLQKGKILLVLLGAPLFTHLALLAAWWGGLKWINGSIPFPFGVGLAWVSSLAFTGWLWHVGARQKVPALALWLRAPAALFFYGLLWLSPTKDGLWLYAIAFAVPYLSLLKLPQWENLSPEEVTVSR